MKRVLDVAVAASALVALAAPLFLVALAVRVAMGPPVLFRHRRVGLHSRTFALLKFRTMRRGQPGEADGRRITPLGRFLRAWSIDELPQLWNVLCGDMSPVGPRPLLPEYLAPVYDGAGAAARGSTWPHRAHTSKRTKRPHLGREVRTRRLVRRPPEPARRSACPL